MSWLVGEGNRGDDLKVLRHPSVKNVIWIGSQDFHEPYWHQWYADNHQDPHLLTSTNAFWLEEGWSKTRLPDLSPLHFTAFETDLSFHDNNYQRGRFPKGEVVVLSRV